MNLVWPPWPEKYYSSIQHRSIFHIENAIYGLIFDIPSYSVFSPLALYFDLSGIKKSIEVDFLLFMKYKKNYRRNTSIIISMG